MRDFWEFIEDVDPDSGKLPLVHSTDLFRFKKIASAALLTPSKDDVYVRPPQNLLYFFYGRPAYRVHSKEKTLSARAYAPVCLVFDNELSTQAIRIMPFDSGAFHSGITHPPMHPDMELGDFELGIDADAPMKLIKVFFGTEKNYFDERPIPLEYPYDDFYVDSFYKLIRLGDNRDADDRISAIEFQVDTNVELKNRVSAVILPAQYLEKPGVAEQIDSWGATGIPYFVQESFKPIEVYGAILNRLRDFYQSKGIL